jgi:hypothetical protein
VFLRPRERQYAVLPTAKAILQIPKFSIDVEAGPFEFTVDLFFAGV